MTGTIESRLRARLLLGGLALSALLAVIAWWWSGRQVRELLDYQLEQVARALVDHDMTRMGPLGVEDAAMHLDIAVWDRAGHLLYRSSPELELRPDTPPGFAGVPSGSQADAAMLRVFTLRSEHRVVQVAHPLDLRQDLAREAGLEVLLVALAGTATLSVLVIAAVRRSLAPLRELGQELRDRNAGSLAPIVLGDVPSELQAPLGMLNELLDRLHQSLARHRRFVSDAAHELRTPLAAVRLQVDNVAHAATAPEREVALGQLRAGVDRAQRLVQQLLALARLEADGGLQREPIELGALASQCLVDHALEASRKDMELALESDGPAWVAADPHALRSLLDNLLGNALKYAPAGSTVVVALSSRADAVRLSVRDRGPGIPTAVRERVLERFYRLGSHEQPGSGLGLAIAAEAARAHGTRLELATPADGIGLEAAVCLAPTAAPKAGLSSPADAASEPGQDAMRDIKLGDVAKS